MAAWPGRAARASSPAPQTTGRTLVAARKWVVVIRRNSSKPAIAPSSAKGTRPSARIASAAGGAAHARIATRTHCAAKMNGWYMARCRTLFPPRSEHQIVTSSPGAVQEATDQAAKRAGQGTTQGVPCTTGMRREPARAEAGSGRRSARKRLSGSIRSPSWSEASCAAPRE